MTYAADHRHFWNSHLSPDTADPLPGCAGQTPAGRIGAAENQGELAAARARRDRGRAAGLLRQRERLAALAAAHSAHDHPDAARMWQLLHELEQTLAQLSPQLWSQQWPLWVLQDAERADLPHDPTQCPLCPSSHAPLSSARAAA